jgi:hypothetical protein
MYNNVVEKVKLLIPQKEAKAELGKRIKEGNEILDTNYISMDQVALEKMMDRRDLWNNYNTKYLKTIFSDDSIAEEYANDVGSIVTASASLEERRDYEDKTIRERISRLKSIVSQLPLIIKDIDIKENNKEAKIKLKSKRYWDERPLGKIIIGVLIGLIISAFLFFSHLPSDVNAPSDQKLSLNENIKDCGSNIDKEGATHTLDIKCFAEAFKTCTPAKIYEEQFPPDNVPSIKTTTLIEGKTDKGCRIQVNVRNVLAIPENNIYYCYSAGMGRADDTQNFNHLVIDTCDNGKTSIY